MLSAVSIARAAMVAAFMSASLAGASAQAPAPGATAGQLTLIVGFAPGGSADSIARVVGGRLGEKTGRKIVVENRPGAGANIAARAVIGAAPDGATLLVTTAALAINETLYRNKGFSASESLLPIAVVATSPEVFAIHPGSPAKTLKEFVELNRNGEIVFGTAGIGTSSHIAGEYFFKVIAKTPAKHVPFRGGPDATNAGVGGHIPMVISSLSGFAPQVASGQLRGLGIAFESRSPVIKDVPTFAESGYAGFSLGSWVGFFAPKGVPAADIAAMNKELDAISREPAIVERLRAIGFDPRHGDVADTVAFMKREYDQWGTMVRELNLSME
jgi:tripartite-type tricarboxylate transporter receptor subunit TctC